MRKKTEKIDIILPSRIGDCILSLPSLLCLKQVAEKFPEKKLKITIFSTSKLTEIIQKLNLFEVKQYSNIQKLRTIFNPSDKAIFLHTCMDNHGFFAKKIHYQNDIPYLYVEQTHKYIPEGLYNFLQEKFNFSVCVIAFFGMILEIGFSVEEIIETFKFDENSLSFAKEITDWKPQINNYTVICMEAAYGSKGDADRRFKEELYFEVSKYIYEKFALKSAFIGIDNKISLPKVNYIYDFRKKLDFLQLAQLLKYSKGYLGNDTGPLHLANLMKKYSLGIYSRETAMKINYYPVFNNLNTPVLGFPEIDIVDNFCSKLVEKV